MRGATRRVGVLLALAAAALACLAVVRECFRYPVEVCAICDDLTHSTDDHGFSETGW